MLSTGPTESVLSHQWCCLTTSLEMFLFATNSSQSYGVSPAIWDHTVLPVTQHNVPCLAITPSRLAKGKDGWGNLKEWKA